MSRRNERTCVSVPLAMSPIDATWLACAIDAEGWIGFYRSKKNDRLYYTPIVGIGNTDRRFIDKVRTITPGIPWRLDAEINPRSKVLPGDRVASHSEGALSVYKTLYRLRSSRIGAVRAIIENIRPYLVIKCDRADMVMRWIEVYDRTATDYPAQDYTVEQHELMEAVRNLNGGHGYQIWPVPVAVEV